MPGQSGNPTGRKKSLMGAVRAKCGEDGATLVDGWFTLAFASIEDVEAKFGAKPGIRDRLAAMGELADRGWDKAAQPLQDADGEPLRVIFGGRHQPTREDAA